MRKSSLSLFALLLLGMLLHWVPSANAAPGDLLFTVGTETTGLTSNVIGVATDSSGNVYVVDSFADKVLKYSSTGAPLASWGSSGSGNGQLDHPDYIAIDPNGYIYVTDINRIQKFDSSGRFVSRLGSYGTGAGQFGTVTGIAADRSGNVYVADDDNNRIQNFDNAGRFLTMWGSYGSGNGQFSYITGVAVDTAGNVYVVDSGNSRIQKFDGSGNFLSSWTDSSRLFLTRALAVDSDGNIYVPDYSAGTVHKFTNSGVFITSWKSQGALCIAVDASGNVFVSGYPTMVNRFDTTGKYIAGWLTAVSTPGQFEFANAVAFDFLDNIYVTDFYNHRVQKFGSNGNFIAAIGGFGRGNGQFVLPTGVAVDASGNLYVADSGNSRIHKFNNSGSFIKTWGSYGSGNGQFIYVQWLAVGTNGHLYVQDSGTDTIQEFDSEGAFIASWQYPWGSTVSGSASYPMGFAVDKSNNIYISRLNKADLSSDILKYTSSGTYLSSISRQGVYIGSLGTDAKNNLFAATVAKSGSAEAYLDVYDPTGLPKGKLAGLMRDVYGPPHFPLAINSASNRIYAVGGVVLVFEGYGSALGSSTAINCGGPAFIDSTGQAYAADSLYSGGSTNSTTSAIPNTSDDKLYQSWRYGNMTYDIPVKNGSYNVTLKFSDWYTTVGKRVFDVRMEGTTVLSNFDIVAKAGYLNAYDVVVPVTVADGVLNIQFVNKVDNAKINAIVVKPASTQPALPYPWQTRDIGSVGVGGSASFVNNTFTLVGSGADIWGTSDSFRFVYQPLIGDGQIVARVASLQNTNGWAKSGVMIRESLTANSAHALVDIMRTAGAEFASRLSTGGSTTTTTQTGIAVPYWVKLVRSGNTFSGYISANGTTWTLLGSQTINMSSTAYVGMVVTSHVNTTLCTSTLNGVSVTTTVGGNHTITATAGTGGSITPSGNLTVPYLGSSTFNIIPNSGYKISDVKVDGISVGAVGNYTFSNVTANHTIAASFTTATTGTTVAINCGGTAYTDSTGRTFAADTYYSGGYINSTTSAIPNTVDDKLYQSWRYGNMSYNIPVQSGNYNVILKFSDWYAAAGKRVFDVKMEGTTVLSNLDIFSKVGYLNPYDVTIPVTVTDGVLNVQFINKVDNAKINAIVVKPR